MTLGALAVGLSAGSAAALGSAMAVVVALTLWPGGAVWSGYAATLWGQVLALALAACLFARWQNVKQPGSGPYAFAAMLLAGVVQGVWAAHPVMVVSDAVFHANRLVAVAGGDLFPTSVTQHAIPFRFPYGVSFYLWLAPFAFTSLRRRTRCSIPRRRGSRCWVCSPCSDSRRGSRRDGRSLRSEYCGSSSIWRWNRPCFRSR